MVQFRELIRRLQDEQVDFVIVGGVAATLYGAMEPTRDLDVCIHPTEETWGRVARVLQGINPRYALTPDKRSFVPRIEELRTFKNLYALTDLGRIDFIGEVPPLGDLERIASTAQRFEIDGREVRVIDIHDLLTVKDHVRRPKDLEVAAELRAILDARSKAR